MPGNLVAMATTSGASLHTEGQKHLKPHYKAIHRKEEPFKWRYRAWGKVHPDLVLRDRMRRRNHSVCVCVCVTVNLIVCGWLCASLLAAACLLRKYCLEFVALFLMIFPQLWGYYHTGSEAKSSVLLSATAFNLSWLITWKYCHAV